jgi:hypothetical protein
VWTLFAPYSSSYSFPSHLLPPQSRQNLFDPPFPNFIEEKTKDNERKMALLLHPFVKAFLFGQLRIPNQKCSEL